jgi:hypothetical protein
VAIQVQKSSDSLSLTDHSLTVLYEGCAAMNTSAYKHGSYLHCRVRSFSFNFKNGYPFAATKVQILFIKEVFARGPTRALSGSCVVNWSLVLLLDTANAQKKS